MKNRSIAAVVLLPFVTFGFYALYWMVSTKNELNQKGAQIPTAWLLIVPIVNYYWIWKYYEGAEQVTNKKLNGVLLFVIHLFVISLVSMAIAQAEYNKLAVAPAAEDASPFPAA